MDRGSKNLVVDRGIALHKMIRLVTLATAGNGYLNFMGNEFGHPEWIDFPREGNGWSYAHARRLWSISDSDALRFKLLRNFDEAMISYARKDGFLREAPELLRADEEKKVLIFRRKDSIFAFNFNPASSFEDYGFGAPVGKYKKVFDSDAPGFDGFGRLSQDSEHITDSDGNLKLYLPCRCALVLKKFR